MKTQKTDTTAAVKKCDQPKASSANDEFRHHTGSDTRYRHNLARRVVYTPGVQELAEECQAYWLIDTIAFMVDSPELVKAWQKDYRLEALQFWRLEVSQDDSAKLFVQADSGVEPAYLVDIPFTDFPYSSVDIWAGLSGDMDGRTFWTLYLPSEH